MSLAIRAYQQADRHAVRTIACDTAERGEPVERFFHDREVFADLLTRYYTDWEPEALWVAERDGQVVGYLTGCLDTRRYHRVMAWRIIPTAVLRGLLRGLLFRSETWRLARAAIATWRLGGLRNRPPGDYSAHLHVNVRRDVRGQQIGQRLVAQFIHQVHTAGLRGIHAAVRGDNPAACRFFERLEFTPLSRSSVAFPAGKKLEFHETVIYGKHP